MIFVNYPGHFVAGLLLAGSAVLTAFAFRSKELQKAELKPYRVILALLQYLSIAILLLILWNPSSLKKTQTISKNSVLVFFDTSESMSIAEDGQVSRLDKALNIFEEKFRPSDAEGPDYRIFGFDHQCYHSGSSHFLRRWGLETNMHSVLALLDKYNAAEEPQLSKNPQSSNLQTAGSSDRKESMKQSKVVGAIIFTDGQADDKNISTYLPVDKKGVEIVFVGVGSKKPQSDIAIKSTEAPTRVLIDTVYKVEAIVAAKNLQNQPVTIELLKDDVVIAAKELAPSSFSQLFGTYPHVGSGMKEVTVEFLVSADKLGRHVLSARAQTVDQEANSANNLRSTIVEVVDRAGLKVLFYSQEANFNIGKVRQALARDSKIELDLGLDVIKAHELSQDAMKSCGYVRLPSSREGFYRYDIIILGPCVLERLSDEQIEGLYSFVADRGGGLILLPGKADSGPAAWENVKAKVLIPVILDYDAPLLHQRPGKIKLTPEGLNSKAIKPAELQEFDELASAYYRIIDKKPAAATLASVDEAPVITVHRVGRGRVCLLNVARLFRWYRQDRQGGLLHKIMSGLTAYVGRIKSAEAAIELFAERTGEQNSKIKFDAYVCNKIFAPVSGANVLLTVGNKVLSMDEVDRGYYAAEIDDITDEAIVATVEAEINGIFLGEKTIAVNLPQPKTEMADVQLDEKFLRALAKKLGGKYFEAKDVDNNIAQAFQAETRMEGISRMTSVWPTWPLLFLLCLLLSFGWFVRRAVGLV